MHRIFWFVVNFWIIPIFYPLLLLVSHSDVFRLFVQYIFEDPFLFGPLNVRDSFFNSSVIWNPYSTSQQCKCHFGSFFRMGWKFSDFLIETLCDKFEMLKIKAMQHMNMITIILKLVPNTNISPCIFMMPMRVWAFLCIVYDCHNCHNRSVSFG